jgi:hypothetical protein
MQTASAADARGRFVSPGAIDVLVVVGSAWLVRAAAMAVWRLAAYAAAAVTFVVDYGLVVGVGHFFNGFFGDTGFLRRLSERISMPGAQTVVRLPLFAAFLVVLTAGCRRLRLEPGA